MRATATGWGRWRPSATGQLPALAELAVPTAIVKREEDVFDHLERLPALPACCAVERVGGGLAALAGRIEAILADAALPPEAPPAPQAAPIPGRITKDFVDTSFGQLLLRRAGDGPGPPLLMIHASPGSAAQIEPLMRAVAATRPVLAFDTIGYGDSDKPPFDDPLIEDYARVVLDALDRLGLEQIDLHGTHTGAMIAAEVARIAPERVRSLVLEGVTGLFDGDELAERLALYTPPFELRRDGSHLLWAWSFLKDMTLFYPWYETSSLGVRRAEVVEPDALAAWVLELLKSGETYPLGYRAAFRYPSREHLPQLRVPTLVCAPASDPLSATVGEAAGLVPGARGAVLPEEPHGAAAVIASFLDGSR